MLCNGKRTNYDAQVLDHAAVQPHAGILTRMPGCQIFGDVRPTPSVCEPARHIVKVASLVECRPVFAW
jgi:hypothetical protein